MKAGQYYNGTDWQQFGLTTDDTYFQSIKDSSDNLYVFSEKSTNNMSLTKIDKNGNVSIIANKTLGQVLQHGLLYISISKNQEYVYYAGNSYAVKMIKLSDGVISSFISGLSSATCPFAIYKDLYIWVASGTTVKIYDYTTKAALASINISVFFTEGTASSADRIDAICLSPNGTDMYLAMNLSIPAGGNRTVIGGLRWQSGGVWSKVFETILSTEASPKQLLIDKWGDLIILTNSGIASTLLKYTTAGVLIDTKTLGQASYNLAIDVDGNYFYYTALKEFQIDKNTAQGQPFTSAGYETRGTGNTGFGSNSTGYQPSVYS